MSDHLLVGTRKGLFHLQRQARGWEIHATHFLGDPVNLVHQTAHTGQVLAVLDTGHFGVKLHRATGLAAEFAEIPVPEYPPKPEDDEDLAAMTRKPLEWQLRAIWALASSAREEPGTIWCGTMPGGVFLSRDHGDTWELLRGLWDHPERRRWFGGGAEHPVVHSICLHPERAGEALVGVSCGGAWKTDDYGASWRLSAKGMVAEYLPPDQQGDEAVQDPHCIVQCPSAPERVWCQHHSGIFQSRDGGDTWTGVEGVEPSAFGFPVAVHPQDPDTAWFVPAIKDMARYPAGGKVVVNRTRDGGQSFETLTEGLPQEHAYDICYRHALDVSGDGQRLAFGSTTGALWLSEDQGDSWQELSAHLPPVYCVRFAAG